VIEREFEHAEGPEPVGSSHSDFGFVVEALDDATGKQLLNPEIVENEFAVLDHGACDFLHGFDPGPYDLAAPPIEELALKVNSSVSVRATASMYKGFSVLKWSHDGTGKAASQAQKPHGSGSNRS
jgi:hypothetical protein